MPDAPSVAVTAKQLRMWVMPGDQSSLDSVFRGGLPPRRPRPIRADRRTDEQMLALHRWRQEAFVSTLAHELRQPLSVLASSVGVVRHAPASAAASRATTIIERQIGQMNRIVEDLMDSMRWACGKVTIRKQRIDAREVVRAAAQDATAAVAGRRQELVVTIRARASLGRRRSTAPPASARESARQRDEIHGPRRPDHARRRAGDGIGVMLCLRDTGRGIDRQSLTHIFDLFSQVRPAEGAGLGIGLSVVREIVALHQGRVEARSEGLGRGSEFIVTLPVASPFAS